MSRKVKASEVQDAIKLADVSAGEVHRATTEADRIKALAVWRADRYRADELIKAFHSETKQVRKK
jgi:hypothetical protein